MNFEQTRGECDGYRDELLRVACRDLATPSETLQAHLAACPTCCATLESSRSLVGALQLALEPEPLPEGLQAEIWARLDAPIRRIQSVPAWMRTGVATAAVAACVLLAILFPRGFQPGIWTSAPDQTGEIALSKEDMAAIAEAYAVLRWDDPADHVLQVLATRTEDVAEAVEGTSDSRSGLPWGPQDDWDVPATKVESSILEAVPAVCAAGRMMVWGGT